MMLVLAIVEIFSVILQRIFCDSTLKKKKIRRYTDYLVWGGYFAVFNGVTYVLTYLGDGTSNIWLNILLFGNYSAPRLGYINFWSKQRKYNFCFIIALLRKVDNFSM